MHFRNVLCVLALFISLSSGNLWGTYYEYNETDYGLYAVGIDVDSGAFYDPILVFSSETIDPEAGISTLDNTRTTLWFAINGGFPFIFGVDVFDRVTVPSIDIGAQNIGGLEYDTQNDALVILAQFGKDTLIVSYSFVLPQITTLLNLTQQGITDVFAFAVDNTNEYAYILYAGEDTNSFRLGQVSLNVQGIFVDTPVVCDSSNIGPVFFAYDPKLAGFVGLGHNGQQIYYFQVFGSKCVTSNQPEIPNQGDIVAVTYDHNDQILFFNSNDRINDKGASLVSVDTNSHKVTTTDSQDVLVDIEYYFQ